MAIAFNKDFSPTYGQVDELSPLVRRVVAKNPNPFTFTGTGVYLVGRGELAVIDPGPTLDEHLDAVMAALDDGERITHILVTHTHTDHTAGVSKLVARTGAATYGFGPHGPVPETDPLETVTFDEYFTAEEKEAFDKAWRDTPDELKREGPDVDFQPDVPVADGDLIRGGAEGGSWTIEVVHTPGHTSNHVCFALQEEKLLFTGDHVMGWATSVISPPDGDLFDYLNSLRKLLARDDQRYWPHPWPGHRRPPGVRPELPGPSPGPGGPDRRRPAGRAVHDQGHRARHVRRCGQAAVAGRRQLGLLTPAGPPPGGPGPVHRRRRPAGGAVAHRHLAPRLTGGSAPVRRHRWGTGGHGGGR